MCLFRVNSSHSTLDRIDAGDILPIDRGAAGRVLLAYTRPADPTYDALRQSGYAYSHGERDAACRGLAAPVFDPTGEIAGALSLSGPAERFTESTIALMLDLLLKASTQLTQLLGGGVPVSKARQGTVIHPPEQSVQADDS